MVVQHPFAHPLERGPVGALLPEVLIPRVEVAVEVYQGHRPELVADRLEHMSLLLLLWLLLCCLDMKKRSDFSLVPSNIRTTAGPPDADTWTLPVVTDELP